MNLPETPGKPTGKVILDCTNPLQPDMSGLAGDRSAAEQVAVWAPGAKVVKIFNTTGLKNMDDPRFGDDQATMFYCGDDAEAKKVAAHLAEGLGFRRGRRRPPRRSPEPGAPGVAVDPPRLRAEAGTRDRVQADAAVGGRTKRSKPRN